MPMLTVIIDEEQIKLIRELVEAELYDLIEDLNEGTEPAFLRHLADVKDLAEFLEDFKTRG